MVAGVLIAVATAAAVWFQTDSGIPPSRIPVAAQPLPERGADRDAPPTQPVTPQSLAERAQVARTSSAHRPVAGRRDEASSSCEALAGAWLLGGEEQLSLQRGGMGTWRRRAGYPAEPVRWLCMQDGTAEVRLDDGPWRLVVEADGSGFVATDTHGARKSGHRAPALQ